MQQIIFVSGGSGFIGREVCRTAIGAGYEVRALSRHGRPPINEAWVDMVSWINGNALEPATWRHHLEGCVAVIHCVGVLQEDPLQGETFERINAEAAIEVAREAEHAGVPSFVMLSAKTAPPLVPDRFLESKRHAESHITQHFGDLRPVFLRPAIVYGPHRASSLIVGRAYQLLNVLPDALNASSVLPLPVESVAAAAVFAATGEDLEGVLDEQDIEDLAETAAGSLRMPQQSAIGTRGFIAGMAAGAILLYMLSRTRK